MSIRVLLGLVVTLALSFPVCARAQAAAESALTNALSSGATVKAGSALNHALDQSSRQLGTRVQERTSSPVQVGAQQRVSRPGLKHAVVGNPTSGNVRAGSSPGMSGVSILGGQVACAPANPSSQASPGKASAGTASVGCHDQQSASKSGSGENKYKSFVTLPPPK